MKVKVTGRASSMVWGISAGVMLSLLLTVISAAVIATLVLSGRMQETVVGYCGYLVIPLSVALGGAVAFWMVKRRRLFVSVLVATSYCCVLYCVVSLFLGGVHHGVVPVTLMAFAGAFCVGVTGLRSRGGGRFDGRKYRPR